jgi:hypothetical protein
MKMATTRKPKIAKTSAELKQELELAKRKVAELEQRAFAEELGELIKNSAIVAAFTEIKSKATGATDTVILTAIANAVGIKRIAITQTAAPARKTYARKTVAKKSTQKK